MTEFIRAAADATATHWMTLSVIAASVVAIIAAAWKGIVRPIMHYAARVEDALVFVEAQMKPNGGSSLRDAVDKVLAIAAALETRREANDRSAAIVADIKEELHP